MQSKQTSAPGVEVSYLPKETDFTGSTVLIFGRQRRTELINQLVSGQSVHHVDELVEALLKFITQPIVVLDNVLTKHSMRRNAATLHELVNSKTVFIGKSDATSFPDNVMAHVNYIFIDNTYNLDERKFMYEHYLKSKIPTLYQLNRSLNALDASEYLVVSVKSGESKNVYVYDIDREAKINQHEQASSQPEQTPIPGITGINETIDESEYVIPSNESIAQLDITPAVTTEPVTTGPVNPSDASLPTSPVPSASASEPKSWISYLTSFIW
jgi:hypothetical protein